MQRTGVELNGDASGTNERKKIEQALNASETRYRRLFETAQDGILILDADTGLIKDVNPFLIEMLGYVRDDIVGRKLWEMGFFRDVEKSREAFERLQTEGYVRYEDLPLERKDGSLFDVEFISNVYMVNGQRVIQCNIRDITGRKKADEALLASNAELTRFNLAMVDRELRMTELKKEINALCAQAGQKKRYPLEFDEKKESY